RLYPAVPPRKFVTIPNGFDEAEWGRLSPGPSADSTFLIVYAGELYLGRNPLPLFRAVRRLIDTHAIERSKVRIELIGWCDVAEGRPVAEMVAEQGLEDCVHIRGPLSRRDTLSRLTQSQVLLLLAERWTAQIPGKTYEYLRSGRPILALTAEGAVADLLRRTGGSWVVDPSDTDGIAAAVREAYVCWAEGRPAP